MQKPTPEDIKALILFGVFEGRIPGNGRGDYVSYTITDEIIHRLGDLSTIELVIIKDPATYTTKIVAHRVLAQKEINRGNKGTELEKDSRSSGDSV